MDDAAQFLARQIDLHLLRMGAHRVIHRRQRAVLLAIA